MSNSQRASIISRPLLNMVAESMVIFRPITHDGCLSACSTVMPANSSIGVSRNGPPEAVRISRRTDSGGRSPRHWKIAECSLSTGSTRTPCLRASAITISPAITRISFEATAISLPARIAANAGCSPAVPTMATNTMSADGRVANSISPSAPEVTRMPSSCGRSSSTFSGEVIETSSGRNCFACFARSSALPPAARPTRRMSLGKSSATLAVLVPIEPVLPSRTTFFISRSSGY